MKHYLVIAYDITNDDRRNKISNILSAHGKRVNKSVFECFLKEKEIQRLKNRIEGLLKKSEDIVLYYYLCKGCLDKIERVGDFSEEKQIVKTF